VSDRTFSVLFWSILLLGFYLRHWGGLKRNKELKYLVEGVLFLMAVMAGKWLLATVIGATLYVMWIADGEVDSWQWHQMKRLDDAVSPWLVKLRDQIKRWGDREAGA